MAHDGGGTPVDFFISYTRVDTDWAVWIGAELQDAGYSTVAQVHDIKAGDGWLRKIGEWLERAERMICVVSPAYFKSDYATAEWHAIFARDPGGRRRILIPVLVVSCQDLGLLGTLDYISLVGLSEGEARSRLFSRLGLPSPEHDPRRPARSRPVRYPGAISEKRWNVPHHKNRNFVDPDDLVGRLHAVLSTEGVVYCSVFGMGGVGKTQLAVTYAFEYKKQYDAVWWISAADMSSLRRDYAELASALGVQEQESDDPDELISAVRNRIEEGDERWLLIFDDSMGPETSLKVLPRRNAKVVITTRNPLLRRGQPGFEVEVFSSEVAVRFLLERSCDTDAEAARQLCDELGRLPLALEQAGAYVVKTPDLDLAGYLELFRSPAEEVLISESDSPEVRSVAATFLPPFLRLQKEAPAAAAVLCLVAFLAPDDIPLDVLLAAEGPVPDVCRALPGDERARKGAIRLLQAYSLLSGLSSQPLGVHRLVQRVVRAHLGETGRLWAEAAVRLLARAFPKQGSDRAAWPVCARLLPHVEVATRRAEKEGVAPAATVELLTRAGGYLLRRYDFANAAHVSMRAAQLAEDTYGPALRAYATTLEQVSIVFCHERTVAEAGTHLERALLVGQAAWGENNDRIGRLLERLAFEVRRPQGEFEAAKAMLERAAGIYERRHGPRHVWVAYASAKLGFVLWDLKDLDAARASFERAQSIFETSEGFGPGHPALAFAFTGLGQVLVDQREVEKGRACQERALAIFKAAFGDHDLDVARTLDKLGYALREQGALEEGRQRHLEALNIFRSVYPKEQHPDVAFAHTNLGMALGELGEVVEARAHHTAALHIFEQFADARFAGIVRGRLADLEAQAPPCPAGDEARNGEDVDSEDEVCVAEDGQLGADGL